MDYVYVEKRHFSYKGKTIRLRGFGIGTWLNIEHFMFGLPASEEMIKSAFDQVYGQETRIAFFMKYSDTFFKEDDFILLKEYGVNFIRVPFNYRLFMEDNNIDVFKEKGFEVFDRLFSLCRKYEIFVLLDLHTSPGSQNPDWHSDNSYGVSLFWKYHIFRRQITKLWEKIAFRYKEEPFLMGYDLLNEPAMAAWSMLNNFYEETISAIRKHDRNHIIVLEGDGFSMDFSGLKRFEEKQLALGFHYYPTVWHPDLLDRTMDRVERKQRMADGLTKLLRIAEEFDCPAFCGEFGFGADCGEPAYTLELLKDMLDLMEERKMDWLLWCYKDARFMSMIYPRETSSWMKLVRNINQEWSQDIEKMQAAQLLDKVKEEWFLDMSEEEKYLLQFRLRACFYLLQTKHIIIPALKDINEIELLSMAEDFDLPNCELYEEMAVYLKGVLLSSE